MKAPAAPQTGGLTDRPPPEFCDADVEEIVKPKP